MKPKTKLQIKFTNSIPCVTKIKCRPLTLNNIPSQPQSSKELTYQDQLIGLIVKEELNKRLVSLGNINDAFRKVGL